MAMRYDVAGANGGGTNVIKASVKVLQAVICSLRVQVTFNQRIGTISC